MSAGAENGFFKRWAGFQASVNESDVQTARLDTYLGMVPGLVTQVANIVVLALGILLIVKGEFTPGSLLAFTGFLSAFMAPVNQTINLGQTIQEMTTQMERVEDVMNYPVDVPEDSSVKAVEDGSPENERWADREKLSGLVAFDSLATPQTNREERCALIEGYHAITRQQRHANKGMVAVRRGIVLRFPPLLPSCATSRNRMLIHDFRYIIRTR